MTSREEVAPTPPAVRERHLSNDSAQGGGRIFRPDPREATCRREQAFDKGPHVTIDFGNHPVTCRKCNRIKGKRYPK